MVTEQGYRIVSGGTDNHLCLVDVKSSIGMSGKQAEKLLDEAGITCNKNTIPFDPEKPFVTSGIRLGSAAMTTRGMKEEQFRQMHCGLRMFCIMGMIQNISAISIRKCSHSQNNIHCLVMYKN